MGRSQHWPNGYLWSDFHYDHLGSNWTKLESAQLSFETEKKKSPGKNLEKIKIFSVENQKVLLVS